MINHQESSFQMVGHFESIVRMSNQHSTSDGKGIIINRFHFKYLVILNDFVLFEIDVQHEMHDE